jgi:hypothetical protein
MMNQKNESDNLNCLDCKYYNNCIMILSDNLDEDNPKKCLDFTTQ